ncbi:anti-sigma factor [Paraburkholderia sp. LEh10]|nr:anti-sigma factor [Paraburkholderia sp. LEh10]
MNLHRYPDLIERLAAEHALGLVRGGARRRLEHYAQRDAELRRALDDWQRRIEPLAELSPARVPPASAWQGIERRLGLGGAPSSSASTSGSSSASPSPVREAAAQPTPSQPRRAADAATAAVQPARWFERLSFWRGWAIGATALAALAAVVAMRALLPAGPATSGAPTLAGQHAPGPTRVAVLNDQDAHAVMFVAWDAQHGSITIQRLANAAPPEGRALQLWGVPPAGHPVSLGVLPASGEIRLPVGEQRPEGYAALAVSIEPAGGSPNPDGPSGPVVYVGKLQPVS